MEVPVMLRVIALDTYAYGSFMTNEGDTRPGGTVYKVHVQPEAGGAPVELRTDELTFQSLVGHEGKVVAMSVRIAPKSRIAAIAPVDAKKAS